MPPPRSSYKDYCNAWIIYDLYESDTANRPKATKKVAAGGGGGEGEEGEEGEKKEGAEGEEKKDKAKDTKKDKEREGKCVHIHCLCSNCLQIF